MIKLVLCLELDLHFIVAESDGGINHNTFMTVLVCMKGNT